MPHQYFGDINLITPPAVKLIEGNMNNKIRLKTNKIFHKIMQTSNSPTQKPNKVKSVDRHTVSRYHVSTKQSQ